MRFTEKNQGSSSFDALLDNIWVKMMRTKHVTGRGEQWFAERKINAQLAESAANGYLR